MTQPRVEPAQRQEPSSTGTVIAAAAIGLALVAVEARVRQQVEEAIAEAIAAIAAAFAAALAAVLASPAALFATGFELLSDPTVNTAVRSNIDRARERVAARIAAGYAAGGQVALARARRSLGDDVPAELPELDTTADQLGRDIDTMFRHAEADLSNTVRVAYDGVQGDDAPRVRTIVTRQALADAAARLQQRAGAAAGTAVNQGASDAQQAIWRAYQNRTGVLGLRKRWVVTAADPCGMCAALHGTVVAVDAEFDHAATDDDRDWRPVWRNLLGPPRHPNCRCQLELVRS